ncbi:uncharacterized protein [Montipora foliosa]|uniref:uncharacterized protein isoform X2 n=1 Tax=Montipora foliosa TaxID=591990 RepID=UPI0035F1DF61
MLTWSQFLETQELGNVHRCKESSITRDNGLSSGDTNSCINRITGGISHSPGNCEIGNEVVKMLEDAINLHQSNNIAQAGYKLRDLFEVIQQDEQRNCMIPTKYNWEVVNCGRDSYFEEDVKCSVRHGIIILDSSNGGALFYESFLNIFAVLSLEISEFQIAEKLFSILINLHERSSATSRRRDLGAAFNNRGCLLMIMGCFRKAVESFSDALGHLNVEKNARRHCSSIDTLVIAVKSNISRLNMMSRNFSKCIVEQENLVKECKIDTCGLPIQTVFSVLHNQVALHTSLGNLPEAEIELQYLSTRIREKRHFLLNFVELQLWEVLIMRGKLRKGAQMATLFELSASMSVHELLPHLSDGNRFVNIEVLEKMVDILVNCGKIKAACELLQSGLRRVKIAFGSDHFNVALLLYKEGVILKLVGDMPGSVEKLERSVNILRSIFGDQHPLLLECYMLLGEIANHVMRPDAVHVYFQRATENVEGIYQVSFLDQLSLRYIKFSKTSHQVSVRALEQECLNDVEEQKIEGLVAEYGQALAILLKRSNVKSTKLFWKCRTKGKPPLRLKDRKGQFPGYLSLISKKYVRDLLSTGLALARQGMMKEASVFFQRATIYSQQHHVTRGIPDAPIVQLYSIVSQKTFSEDCKWKIKAVFNSYLDEIATDSGIDRGDGYPEESAASTSNCEFDWKMLLILLIVLSLQFKMHDTTFAAYEQYSSLSLNNEEVSFSLSDEIQVYASRTSIACNGKTILQDFLFSSGMNFMNTGSGPNFRDGPLYKSVASKKFGSRQSLLASYSGCQVLDIEDLKQLEEKMRLSFQDICGAICLDGEVHATQVVVDLTPISSVEINPVPLISRQVELLPICLTDGRVSEDVSDERRNILEIFPRVCEKITKMIFVDEPTSHLMFSRIVVWLLKQFDSEKIFLQRIHHQCLTLAVTDPFKVRFRLWHEDTSIKLHVQVVSSNEENCRFERPATQCGFCSSVFEKYNATALLKDFKILGMATETTSILCCCSCSFEIQTSQSESSGESEVELSCLRNKAICSALVIEESEGPKGICNCFDTNTLECLQAISEISRQLYEDVVYEEEEDVVRIESATQDHCSNKQDQNITSSSFCNGTSSGQIERPTYSSGYVVSTENESASLIDGHRLVIPETNDGSLNDTFTTINLNEDARVVGRKLFEEGRVSRSTAISQIQDDLRKKRIPRQISLLQCKEGSSNKALEECPMSFKELPLYGAQTCNPMETVKYDQKRVLELDPSGHKNTSLVEQEKKDECTIARPFYEKGNPNESREVVLQEKQHSMSESVTQELPSQMDHRRDFLEGGYLDVVNEEIFEVRSETNCNRNASATEGKDFLLQSKKSDLLENAALRDRGQHDSVSQGGWDDFLDSFSSYENGSNECSDTSKASENIREKSRFKQISENETHIKGRTKRDPSHRPLDYGAEVDCPRTCNVLQETPILGPENLISFLGKESKLDCIGSKSVTNFHFTDGIKSVREGAQSNETNQILVKDDDVVDGPVIFARRAITEYPELLLQIHHRKDSLEEGYLDVVNEDTFEGRSEKNCNRNASAIEGKDFHLQSRKSDLLENATLRDRGQHDSVSQGGWDDFLDNFSSYENGSNDCSDTSKVTEEIREKSRFKQIFENETHIKGDLSLHPLDNDVDVDCPKTCSVLPETAILWPKSLNSFHGKESKLDHPGIEPVTNHVREGIKRLHEGAQSSETNQKLVEDNDVTDCQVTFTRRDLSSDLGGARPKTRTDFAAKTSDMYPVLTKETERGSIGAHPELLKRHLDTSALKPSILGYQSYNIATRDELQKGETDDRNSSSTFCSHGEKLNPFAGENGANSPCFSQNVVGQQKRFTQQDECWHFPPLPENSEDSVTSNQSQPHLLRGNEENFSQISAQLFDIPEFRSTFLAMASLTSEYIGEGIRPTNSEESAISGNGSHTMDMDQGTRNSIGHSIGSLLRHLKDVMTKNLQLWLSSCNEAKHTVPEQTQVENVGVQEHSHFQGENESNELRRDAISDHQILLLQQSEQSSENIGEGIRTPVQETPRPVCGHYQRRCLVSFPCCGKFYPCHRCHNDSNQCFENQARAINATHIRCSICYHEQEIDEGSQTCGECNSTMSEYFCAICKHFTSIEKSPFHCQKCGICRIHSDKSFHCDVCNVCLDKRLQGKHKCRPDSGHDECCICLEDAFSGCQILPCSHKVHKDCAIAMIQNGVRTCPVCRYPLFQPANNDNE